MCVCVCIYIYIYIYIWMHVCESVCVCRWVAKEEILSLTGISVSRETPLSTLVWKLHKDLCLWDRKRRMKRVRSWTLKQSIGSETQAWSQDRAVKMMKRWVSIFGNCMRFSLSSCNGHELIYIEWWSADFTFLCLQF